MNPWQAQTNAQLFYAQRLLSIFKNAESSFDHQDQQALMAAFWLCMKDAWVNWLNELATYMNLECAGSCQFSDFPGLFEGDLPEAQLLNDLSADSNSWLSIMLGRLVEPSKRRMWGESLGGTDAEDRAALIKLVSLDEQDEVSLMKQMIAEFKHYVQLVRGRQAEW